MGRFRAGCRERLLPYLPLPSVGVQSFPTLWDQPGLTSWPPAFAAADSFDVDAINLLSASFDRANVSDLEQPLNAEWNRALQEQSTFALGWQVLAGASSLVLRSKGGQTSLDYRWMMEGSRSPSAEDFSFEQVGVLADVAPRLEHLGLRARLGDLCWTVDRKLGRAAKLAFEAYADAAILLVAEQSPQRVNRVPGAASMDALLCLERSLHLAHMTQKKGLIPEGLQASFQTVYQRGLSGRRVVPFVRTVELGLHYGLLNPLVVAADCEVVGSSGDAGHHMPRKALYDLAARLYDQGGDREGEKRCLLAGVEALLAMRKEVHGAAAEAHWVQTALFALRHIRGTDQRRRELRRELRDLQEDSLGEMGTHGAPIDLGDSPQQTISAFEKLGLSESLKAFALLSGPPSVVDLRKQLLRQAEQFPIQGLFSKIYSDIDGKNAATAPGTGFGEEPTEEWFLAAAQEHERLRHQLFLAMTGEPARSAIVSRFNIQERHFVPIAQASPVVRQEQTHLFSLGFASYFQGDFRAAVHLLVPQIEPSLRYLLRLRGHDPTVEFDDMTEENVGLGTMLSRFRRDLEEILGIDRVFEIDILFNQKSGSALRHSVAHGTLGAGGCFAPDAVYACWLLYQLVCLPLVRDWDRTVGPVIDGQA
jgi:hypothetical protein